MNCKQSKRLRKSMKLKLSPKDGYKADYRIASEKEKIVYFNEYLTTPSGKRIPTGVKNAVKAKRIVIVNVAKLPYRRVKKDFRTVLAGGSNETIKG